MLLIALKTHWSREEILSLPSAEFEYILTMLSCDRDQFQRYREQLRKLDDTVSGRNG